MAQNRPRFTTKYVAKLPHHLFHNLFGEAKPRITVRRKGRIGSRARLYKPMPHKMAIDNAEPIYLRDFLKMPPHCAHRELQRRMILKAFDYQIEQERIYSYERKDKVISGDDIIPETIKWVDKLKKGLLLKKKEPPKPTFDLEYRKAMEYIARIREFIKRDAEERDNPDKKKK